MKIWVLCRIPPVVRDTAYLIGCLATRFSESIVTPVPDDAVTVIPPPVPVDIIWNRTLIVDKSFLSNLDRIAKGMGVRVVNAGAPTYLACDKRTYREMYSGLIPQTWVVTSEEQLLHLSGAQGATLVIKHPFGKFGREVELFRGPQDLPIARQLLATHPTSGLVVQEFCTEFQTGDKRVIVHRTCADAFDIAAWYMRTPPPGGWKSNLSSGGSLHMCELGDDEKVLAINVARLSGLDFVGIDLGRHKGRPLLIETNAYAGGHIDFDMEGDSLHSGDQFARLLADLAIATSLPPLLEIGDDA